MNLIVFDIDDTITKSETQHQTAYVEAMKAFGITKINQNWKTYTHHTDSFILKENYEQNQMGPFDFSFIEGFEQKMTEFILDLKPVSAIQGAKDVVDLFNQHPRYAVAFATGSLLKPAHIKLNQAQIAYHKNLVVGSNQIYEREGIVQAAIEKAKVHYKVNAFDHIIAVGDGIWDLKTAQNLGLHFIGIGMKNYNDFKAEKIKVHIKNWEHFNLIQTLHLLGIQ